MSTPFPSDGAPPFHLPGTASASFGELRVHAVRSGFVACKEPHRTQRVPDALRLPAIVLSRTWTEWMPVLGYVVEHPEGVFVIDPGQLERTSDAEALDCDPGTRWFYRSQLRLAFRPEERIDRRLTALGVDPQRVRGVVVSHRHADHSDALEVLPPAARIYVGARDWPEHRGALPRHFPAGREPVLVHEEGPRVDAFPCSTPLTRDGAVRVVPLAGHSPGHLGLFVTAPDGTRLLFAGDAVFSEEQVEGGIIAGICEAPVAARRTVALVRQQLAEHPTLLLPAHEAAALERLSLRGAGRGGR